MKGNTDKCHLLLMENEKNIACINNTQNKNSFFKKLLRVIVDSNLKFDIHVSSLCKKATSMLNPLPRISTCMSVKKERTILKAFITSNCSCYLLVWRFTAAKGMAKLIEYMKRV